MGFELLTIMIGQLPGSVAMVQAIEKQEFVDGLSLRSFLFGMLGTTSSVRNDRLD